MEDKVPKKMEEEGDDEDEEQKKDVTKVSKEKGKENIGEVLNEERGN